MATGPDFHIQTDLSLLELETALRAVSPTGWKPNGWLEDRACRDLLLVLEKKGLITLPASKQKRKQVKKRPQQQGYLIDTSPCEGSVSDYSSLTFSMIRKTSKEGLWNHLVTSYHYLGNPLIVGSHLKYLAYLNGQVVACLGWGSAAWKVQARDSFIGWDQDTRKRNLHLVANNVRFLILPWVRVPHLASKILAANVKLLVKDWLDFYHVPLVLLETFVESAKFNGTCYKEAASLSASCGDQSISRIGVLILSPVMSQFSNHFLNFIKPPKGNKKALVLVCVTYLKFPQKPSLYA